MLVIDTNKSVPMPNTVWVANIDNIRRPRVKHIDVDPFDALVFTLYRQAKEKAAQKK